MTTDIDETGPIDYLIVEFPGSRMTGEGFPLLVGLVEAGLIPILDLVFVTRPRRHPAKQHGVLGDAGVLSDAEFENEKRKILGG
jgi:hypothetical protein